MGGLEPNDLVLFARVVEAGSFSRAAERLQLPKSTVSRRIAELERRLGERLLARSTRRLAVTDFGQAVLEHARRVASEVDNTLALAHHRQAQPSGRLRVSMPGDLAMVALAGMLGDFVRRFPAITLELDLSPRRVDLIGENFDLAVRMGALGADSQLAARLLGRISHGLYAAPEYLERAGTPAAPEDLAAHAGLVLLSRAGDAVLWHLHGPAGTEPVAAQPRVRVLANSPELLLRFARDGAGIASVPDHYAAPVVQAGALVRVLPPWSPPPGEAWAVFPERRLMPARTRVFIDAVLGALAGCDRSAPAA